MLLVDDDLNSRAAIAELLVDLGHWPVTARNGLEALELMRRGVRPVAVMIDLYMPLMDGESLCRELESNPELRDIPRLLISAAPNARGLADRCGAAALLAKPVDPDALEAALRALKP